MEKQHSVEILNTKTHRRLRKAYCRLLRKTDAEKITVSSLTNEADISRATFYTYFNNIEEFKAYSLEYMVNLYIKQIGLFLKVGKQEAKEACRRRNLIFTDDDFELYLCLFGGERAIIFDESLFRIAFKICINNMPFYFSEKFIKKNRERLDLFFIGYTAVMRNNFLDYHSDKAYRDVMRTFYVWESLFPKYKFENSDLNI